MSERNKAFYRKYSQENLEKALAAVQRKHRSIGAAAKEYGVPKSTLKDYARGKSTLGKKAGRRPSIPPEIENRMIDRVIDAAKQGFPLTKRQFLVKVGKLVKDLRLKTQFKKNHPSEEYWRSLKKRRPDLTFQNPEACATSRMGRMNPQVVASFFHDLASFMSKHGLDKRPDCIWNADETGVQFATGTAKVITKKGCRQLHSRTADTRDSVTILACISASGSAMTPLFVTEGKTLRSVQSFAAHDAPQGSVWTYQENAWKDNCIGVEWFKQIFLKQCGPARPQLLILDSHTSHEIVEMLEIAREENIHILALPPYTAHHLQPLDKVVFGPFKESHARHVTEFMSDHPELKVNKITWPSILNKVWSEVMTDSELLRNSFEATGIHPVDSNKIPPEAFAPSIALSCTAQPPPESIPAQEESDQMEEETTTLFDTTEILEQEDTGQPPVEMEEAAHQQSETDTVVVLPIAAEDVKGLQGLVIEVEVCEPTHLDTADNGASKHPG